MSPTSPISTPQASTTPWPEETRTIHLVGLARKEVPVKIVDVGTGPTVVFLHGLVGLNDHWDDVVRSVQHKLRCILLQVPLLDLTGDDCNIDGVTYLTAEFMKRHIASTGGERPIVVGNSFGGHAALKLAIEHPELVRALVLAGASGLIEKSMVRKVEIRPSRQWLSEKIGELFYDRTKMRESDLDRAFAELSHRSRALAMVKLSKSARRNHLGDEIHRIQCPTLLIWGRQDIVTPPEAADQFLKGIPDARIDWYEPCGHAPMIECPDQFARSMLTFADELKQRGVK